jgi:hypothetical protein
MVSQLNPAWQGEQMPIISLLAGRRRKIGSRSG